MSAFVTFLFGTSWKSSLIGLAGGIITAAVAFAQAQPQPGWYVVSLALVALGRLAKDANVTGGTVPATPEAKVRVQQ